MRTKFNTASPKLWKQIKVKVANIFDHPLLFVTNINMLEDLLLGQKGAKHKTTNLKLHKHSKADLLQHPSCHKCIGDHFSNHKYLSRNQQSMSKQNNGSYQTLHIAL